MKTISHFKELYKITKKQGIKEALMYDLDETVQKHPYILMGASILYLSIFRNPKNVSIDTGVLEGTYDSKKGEIIKLIHRRPNSDITDVFRVGPDGDKQQISYCSIKYENGWSQKRFK